MPMNSLCKWLMQYLVLDRKQQGAVICTASLKLRRCLEFTTIHSREV